MSNKSPGPCVTSTASESSSGYGGTSVTPKTAMAAEAAQKLWARKPLGTGRTHWGCSTTSEPTGSFRLGGRTRDALPPQSPLVHSDWEDALWGCSTTSEPTGSFRLGGRTGDALPPQNPLVHSARCCSTNLEPTGSFIMLIIYFFTELLGQPPANFPAPNSAFFFNSNFGYIICLLNVG